MKISFRGLSPLLGGLALVAFACFTNPSCSATGGFLQDNGSGGASGNGDGGSGDGGKGGNSNANGGTSGGSGGSTTSAGGNNNGGSNNSGGASASGGKAGSGGATGSGGKTNAGGSGSGGKGGGGSASGGTTSAGGSSSAGGTTTSAGGTVGAGGASTSTAAGGSTSTGTAATCTTDLMTLRNGADNNWIPSTPQSCGVQGSVYAYSDGSTCTSPSPITASACTSGATGGCCISGTTVIDSTSAKWGCGLGLDLNSSAGATPVKSAYAGAAKGFKITITGTVATGQVIRIMYGSAATDPTGGTAPYKEVAGVGTYSVLFSDATCPTWATGTKCAVVSGSAAYSLKVQIPGGSATTDKVGAFSNVCITSITPI